VESERSARSLKKRCEDGHCGSWQIVISRIAHKLIIAVSGVAALALASISYVLVSTQQEALLRRVENAAGQLSDTIKGSTKYYMLRNDRDDLHRVVDTVAQQAGIEKIRIFNKEGEIQFSSSREEMHTVVDQKAEACYVCHAANKPMEHLSSSQRTRIFADKQGVRNFGIINPIYNEPRCSTAECHEHSPEQKVLGVLDITMSLADVDQQIRTGRNKMAGLTVALIALLAVLLWFLVQRLVGSPVQNLVEATRKVAEGKLDYQIEVKSKDELGHLAESFNTMTSRLSDAQRQIYQADRLASIGRLSAGVAHELNNPMTGILTFSSMLLGNKGLDAGARADLEVIVRETKRCREIVKSLLDFSRQTPTSKSPLDLNEVILQALKILENQFALGSVALMRNLSEGIPKVSGDAGRLEQVFINLLVNAIDAIGEKGGEITLATGAKTQGGQTWVEATVRDNGAGISQKDLAKIFEPFFSTKGLKGTGLGLSVVWGIIEQHGGKILVESEPGKGTAFAVLLPAV
jgi:two-component system, NtrC family, sensor kinase